MILLIADSLLLLFITLNLGALFLQGLEKGFRCRITCDPLGLFLTGLALSTVYFQFLSFWLPVNYLSLIPLLVLSSWVFSRRPRTSWRIFLPDRFSQHTSWPSLRPYILPLLCILLLLCCYAIKPPTSPDSRGYHFSAILWYERFRVVPGLGNLHGRLAFDPASFLISAAYSLTGLTGQSIYPLNTVLITLFFLWILARVIRNFGSLESLVWIFLLILLFGPLLAYMSSPSSDPLVLICIAYPLIRLFELLRSGETVTLPAVAIPLLLILYAPIAKLSAYPLLPMIPFIFFLLPAQDKRFSRTAPLLLLALFLYLPWMGRNYIMSGYLVYPLPYPDLFHPDWKIPADMLQIDFAYGKYSARSVTNTLAEFRHLQSLPFFGWFVPQLSFKLKTGAYLELFLLLAALASPLLWLRPFFQSRSRDAVDPAPRSPDPRKSAPRLFFFWLLLYAGTWLWTILSMDFRFGTIFLILAIIFPLLQWATQIKQSPRAPALASLLLVAATLYYMYGAFRLFSTYARGRSGPLSLACWIFPLKDARAYPAGRPSCGETDFPNTILHGGTKLYLSDSCHLCMNAELPCAVRYYGWLFGKVEMRGARLDQGFRNNGTEPQQESVQTAR